MSTSLLARRNEQMLNGRSAAQDRYLGTKPLDLPKLPAFSRLTSEMRPSPTASEKEFDFQSSQWLNFSPSMSAVQTPSTPASSVFTPASSNASSSRSSSMGSQTSVEPLSALDNNLKTLSEIDERGISDEKENLLQNGRYSLGPASRQTSPVPKLENKTNHLPPQSIKSPSLDTFFSLPPVVDPTMLSQAPAMPALPVLDAMPSFTTSTALTQVALDSVPRTFFTNLPDVDAAMVADDIDVLSIPSEHEQEHRTAAKKMAAAKPKKGPVGRPTRKDLDEAIADELGEIDHNLSKKDQERLRNRLAAKRCRAKKKEAHEEMMHQHADMEAVHKELTAEKANLRRQRFELVNELLAHYHCGDPIITKFLDSTVKRAARNKETTGVSVDSTDLTALDASFFENLVADDNLVSQLTNPSPLGSNAPTGQASELPSALAGDMTGDDFLDMDTADDSDMMNFVVDGMDD